MNGLSNPNYYVGMPPGLAYLAAGPSSGGSSTTAHGVIHPMASYPHNLPVLYQAAAATAHLMVSPSFLCLARLLEPIGVCVWEPYGLIGYELGLFSWLLDGAYRRAPGRFCLACFKFVLLFSPRNDHHHFACGVFSSSGCSA